MMKKKLFAVYLGGRAARCNTELHDVVFVVGENIEATYEQLMDKWFGDPLRMHIDSWMELQVVDGHRISLQTRPAMDAKKLFFVNLGAYQPGQFTELHANALLVAADEQEAKQRAKGSLLKGAQSVHTDDLFDVDDCLEITEVDGQHLHLEPTSDPATLEPQNGYHIIPPAVVSAYAESRKLTPTKRPH
jgi:hypothetical protein